MAKINSTSTTTILGRLQQNDTTKGKELLKLATGQKLNSAGDDTSGYTISERMRVRLRALDKANENTKTGYNMLDTASAAVQEQLDLMRTIKEKVINAHNDSNTDADRLTIQKEIDHNLQQIQDIAYETTYNGKRLLSGGDYVKESVFAWEKLDYAVKVEGSDKLNIIPDIFDVLDDQEGAFDVFSLWKTNTSDDGGETGLRTAAPWKIKTLDAGDVTPCTIEATFNYESIADMDDNGVRVYGYNSSNSGSGYKYFVFSRDSSDNYASGYQKVDISGFSTVAEAVSKLAQTINSDMSSYFTASSNDNKLTLTSKCMTTRGDDSSISGTSYTNIVGYTREAAVDTGASFGRFSGGGFLRHSGRP